MAALDLVSLFPSVPYKFVKKSVKRRWKDMKKKLPFNEFLKGLEFLKLYKIQLIDQTMNSKGFFWTSGDDTFVQNSYSYEKVPSENFHKKAQISTN